MTGEQRVEGGFDFVRLQIKAKDSFYHKKPPHGFPMRRLLFFHSKLLLIFYSNVSIWLFWKKIFPEP